MSWSYDPTNLDTDTSSGRLNVVRLLVGDTDTNDQQIQNEEITFALAQTNDRVYFAAGWAARTIASKYSRQVNTQIDGALSADYSDLAAQYAKLAEDLEYQGKKAGGILNVAAGGITISDVNAVRENTNRIEGSFRRDQFKNPPSYETPEYE
jgi:hypothetical protein